MKTIEIVEKEYLPEQQKLLDIFRQHGQSAMPELPVVFKIPDIPNKVKTHINRVPCKTLSKRQGYMIIAMEVVDFVRLMVKSGIEMKISDKENGGKQR
ncbi:hypothetical protein Sgly_0330 [Syntrophobotulus glycolicus DSM 8271]|uniref:Uncharacterized protein n=1 Tax=Syntrophobotulus glycolicus (strain DSM 8271 / FlGlyR) TaxID=645991 RepID=F0SXF0_SYNGF|nr:hypothetical protein [Syntrophobotulus glycolicus]ADY54696.1 hypothetical protein Sgly_0330 [Syntrophobotulus glycolicus DSM 8271]